MKSLFTHRRTSERSQQPEHRLRLSGSGHLFKTAAEQKLADILENAEDLRMGGSWFEAEQAFARAADLGESGGISPLAKAVTWALSGEFQEQLNRRPMALDCYELAARAAEEGAVNPGADQALRYLCHNNLAWLLKAEDRYAESEDHYVQAANLAAGAGPDRQLDSIVIHNNLGALYHAAGYFPAASQLHRKALEMLESHSPGNSGEKGRSLRMLALAALFQNDLDGALSALEGIRDLGWDREDADEERIIELLVTESSIRLAQRNLREAEMFGLRAIEYCLDAQRRVAPLLPLLYTNLAGIYTHADHIQDAADLLQDAHLMRLSNLHCPDEELALSCQNLVILSAKLGDWDAVERHQQRLAKLGCEVKGNLDELAGLSPADLAACLTTYAPAPMRPLAEQSLGPKPGGLAKLQSWLGALGKTMRIPKR